MNKKQIITLLLAVSFVWMAGFAVLTAGEGKKGMCAMGCVPGKLEKATVTGTNYCVACDLKTGLNAAADCKKYGHQHALKITHMVDACGEVNNEFIGQTFFYLANDKSEKLLKGEGCKGTVVIKGKVYLAMPVIEVEEWKTEIDAKHEKHAG